MFVSLTINDVTVSEELGLGLGLTTKQKKEAFNTHQNQTSRWLQVE